MAVGGLGSAAVQDSNLNLTDNSPTAGGQTQVTLEATANNGSSNMAFINDFSQDVNATNVDTVEVNGNGILPASSTDEPGVLSVAVDSSDYNSGDTVSVTYTITTENTSGKSVTISGNVTHEGDVTTFTSDTFTTQARTGGGGGGLPPGASERGTNGQWNPGFDDGDDETAANDGTAQIGSGAILFQGEDNIDDFTGINSASQVSRTGGANEGTPLDNPIPQDAPTGTYAVGGANAAPGAIQLLVHLA